MQFIRSLIFSSVMIATTMITSFILVLLYPLPFRFRTSTTRTYALINILALKYICNINYIVEGRENIPQTTSLIFSKHQSTWETLALQTIFPTFTFVVKRELLWIPFFGWGLAALRPIAINRSSGRSAIKQVVKQGIQRLKSNIWIIIFPEGTRVSAGTKGRYLPGGAVLASQSGFPVVPVAHNAGECWPRGQFLKIPGTITVVIGPQIPTKGRKADEILTDTENWIETTMLRISKAQPNRI
ncbi:MAG: 1-acyl-sn-glycerol-3-phosphate acyltransferase [Gammaproteobacteria bacterium]|nr:1-acyl-sn-glycerol-3-phosphate acyltransferase [Gammaproteobacteria bacterium]